VLAAIQTNSSSDELTSLGNNSLDKPD